VDSVAPKTVAPECALIDRLETSVCADVLTSGLMRASIADDAEISIARIRPLAVSQ
jgi:hypothetical protein